MDQMHIGSVETFLLQGSIHVLLVVLIIHILYRSIIAYPDVQW
jgi:hypothetical protein